MRKPIAISISERSSGPLNIVVLCDDGSIWYKKLGQDYKWIRQPDIPQDDVDNSKPVSLGGVGVYSQPYSVVPI